MAGSNSTIGTGAVVLTANADRLAAGLDKAARDVGKFAEKADRQAKKAGGGSGGGGILGQMLGVAGGIGLAGIAGKAVDFVSNLLGDLETRANKVKLEPNVRKGVEGVDRSVKQLSNTFDTMLLTAVAKLEPMFERITPALEAVLYVGEALFEEVVDGVAEVVTSISKWVDETFGLTTTTSTAGEVMFGVFKAVGKAVAYVFDTIKAAGGAIAVVAGLIVEGFGEVIKVVGEAILKLGELAQALPESIRPDWIKDAGEAVAGWGSHIDRLGERMRR